MFARKNRFSFNGKVPRKIFSSPFFIIRYDKNEEKRLLCAVVVGKKVDKRAAVRNKIKRQLVSIMKDVTEPTTPITVVLFAKKAILDSSFEAKKEELAKAVALIK